MSVCACVRVSPFCILILGRYTRCKHVRHVALGMLFEMDKA